MAGRSCCGLIWPKLPPAHTISAGSACSTLCAWAAITAAAAAPACLRACLSAFLLLQDCVFLKEPGFAETNWHSDLRMAPLDTNDFITAWIPLRPVQGGERDSG